MGRRILTVVATLSLTMLALELLVRWIAPQPLQHIQVDDELYFVNRPAARFTYARRGEYSVPVTYNAWGFRGPIPAERPASSTTRIVLLGDSQTEGLQVRFDETYGSVMQRELERLLPDRRVEVVNLAVSAYGTHQELLTLRRYGARLHPDWLILGFYPDNDLADNVRLPLVTEDDQGVRLVPHHFSFSHRLLLGTKVFLGGVSHLYVLLSARLKALLAPPLLSKLRLVEPPAPAPSTQPVAVAASQGPSRAYRITEGLIRVMRADADSLGAPLVVLTIPSKPQVVPPASGADVADFIADFERAGILHVEVLAALRQAQQSGSTPFFRIDGHLNAVGHRIVGETLARWLAPRMREQRPRVSLHAS